MNKFYFFVIFQVIFTLLLLRLISIKKLLEKYVVLWVIAQLISLVAVPIVFYKPEIVSKLGFVLGSNLLFVFCFIVLSGIVLQMSIELTKIERKLETIAIKFAILEEKLNSK